MNWEEKYLAIAELVDGYRRERDEALERVRLLEAEVERVTAREDATRRELSETRIDMRDAQRERDEARAEVERLRETKDYLRTWLSSEELEGLRVKAAEHPLLWEEIHHLKDEVKRLREALEASGEP